MTGERSPGVPLWSSRGNLEKCYAESWAGSIYALKGSRSFTGSFTSKPFFCLLVVASCLARITTARLLRFWSIGR